MARLVGVSAASVLLGLAALHVYWAGGGRWGSEVAVPKRSSGQPTFVPGWAATLIVSTLLFSAALVLLGRLQLLGQSLPPWLFAAGAWVLVVVFVARVVGDLRWFGLFKRVKGTRFARWDTMLYVPLCGLLALASLLVATNGP